MLPTPQKYVYLCFIFVLYWLQYPEPWVIHVMCSIFSFFVCFFGFPSKLNAWLNSSITEINEVQFIFAGSFGETHSNYALRQQNWFAWSTDFNRWIWIEIMCRYNFLRLPKSMRQAFSNYFCLLNREFICKSDANLKQFICKWSYIQGVGARWTGQRKNGQMQVLK